MENYITEVDILDEAKDNFLTYAEEVLTDRAIPNAEDGLLSAQRKLLWTMNDYLKMNSKGKTKKCQGIVGSTLSTSYFHGDASCYGVLCKMSQEYLMRYPLVIGQGGLGTQEDNSMVASARYTEAKPSIYADLMFNDFKKNVVPLKETYNGEYMEPIILPGLFPNALVNGREAIGISMAHGSLPNNLTEVCNGIIAYIKAEGNINTKELMEYIPGPDFPLPNTIINKNDIYTAFDSGKSNISLKVRGEYEVDGQTIIFTSIPYRTYRNKIKEQINANIENLDKILEDFNDESSVGENRLVFKVRKDVSVKKALDTLFRLTDLQTTLSYNMNFIINGTPKLCSLKTLIKAYVEHQTNVLLTATQYDRDKAAARVHILNGLLAALDKIDEVIQLIKEAQDKNNARNKLIEFLSIDTIQADAILDMKLSRLTRIDKNELVQEQKEKELLIIECDKIINDKVHRDNVLINKIIELRDKYGDERRTKLIQLEEPKEDKEIINVEPEKCVVIMTKSGNVKRIPAVNFKTQRRNTKGVKTQDDITSAVIRTNTVDNLMIFTNKGKMYRLLVDNVPTGTAASKGQSIKSLISMNAGEEPVLIYSIYRETDAQFVLFTTKNGLVKKTPLSEYIQTKKNSGIAAIKFKEGDELASVSLIKDEDVILITANGIAIHIKSSEIPISSRVTMGNKGITLNKEDYVISALPIRDKNDNLAVFTQKGYAKQTPLKEFPSQGRAGKGLSCYKLNAATGLAAAAALVNDEDNVLILGDKSSVCLSAKEIPNTGRAAAGNIMIKNNHILGVSKT